MRLPAVLAAALHLSQPAAAQPTPEFWTLPATLVHSEHPDACTVFAEPGRWRGSDDDIEFRIALPNGAEQIEPDRVSDYEYAGHYAHYVFDVDNDGVDEQIVALHARTTAVNGDTYFVYENGVPEIPPVGRGDFARESRAAYEGTASRALPGGNVTSWFDATFQIQSSAVPYGRVGPTFRSRYLYLRPFRFEGITYFRTASREHHLLQYQMILRPEPDGTLTGVCLFSFPQIPAYPA